MRGRVASAAGAIAAPLACVFRKARIGFAIGIRVIFMGAFFRQTGFHFAGKCSNGSAWTISPSN